MLFKSPFVPVRGNCLTANNTGRNPSLLFKSPFVPVRGNCLTANYIASLATFDGASYPPTLPGLPRSAGCRARTSAVWY